MGKVFVISLAFIVALIPEASLGSQKFYPDDPMRRDRDDLPIDKPAPIELSPTYDILENTFVNKIEGPIPRAVNVNTLGEVPDSSWFTNRIGTREMTLDELRLGPSRTGPPDTAHGLTIVAAKSGGITPGFTLRDSRGKVYFVKFDPLEHPKLSTAADVISKLFFYALGYNVPENYVTYLNREDLRIEPGAKVSLPGGKEAPMDEEYLDTILAAAARRPDGSIRAVASLMIDGDLLGPFKFYDTRPDDPNDIFPHEHRRELRGYRVFCAWLNHDDSRAINTLDAYVRNGEGQGFVKHYLIDFGSTLGSGSDVQRRIAPQDPRAGNEYIVDFEPIWRTAYTFGIWERPWMKVEYPYPQYAEVGRIEADFFEPQKWKPEYPNSAFLRMQLDDAFWAAKIVARFSDEAIRTIVETGEYSDPGSEQYLADVLIERRNKIVSYYFRQIAPLDGFRVTADRLEFENLGEAWDLAEADAYEYEWFVFDNQAEESTSTGDKGRADRPTLTIPPTDADFLKVRIRTICPQEPLWNKAVDVYLRLTASPEVVGIEREI